VTDEIDILKKAIHEHEVALKMKNLNNELYEHLAGSIYYLLKYSEEYGIPLPKNDELRRMLERADFLIDEIVSGAKKQHPNLNTEKNNDKHPDSEQILISKHLLFEHEKFG
jgi:hypothetical protein